MDELLNQSLQLTLYGMGMTFAAIGSLVLGMYLLTALTAERTAPAGEEATAGPEDLLTEVAGAVEEDDRYLAAAAAVAVAMATTTQPSEKSAPGIAVTASGDAWNAYVRERRLAGRLRHDLRTERRRAHHN